MYPQSMFWAKIRKIAKLLYSKFSFFTILKISVYRMGHGHVFVMYRLANVGINISTTAKVIWRQDLGLKSHPTDWLRL